MRSAATRRRLCAPARRQSILDAALQMFAISGYERTRVADIAEKLGVTEPVIFQNFGSKAGLFAAVLNQAADKLATQLADLDQEPASVSELLERLLSPEHLDWLHSPGGIGLIFMEAASGGDQTVRRALRRAHSRTIEAMTAVLRRGQGEGSVRADVEAEALAWLILSHIHGRQFRRTHGKPSVTIEGDLQAAVMQSLTRESAVRTG